MNKLASLLSLSLIVFSSMQSSPAEAKDMEAVVQKLESPTLTLEQFQDIYQPLNQYIAHFELGALPTEADCRLLFRIRDAGNQFNSKVNDKILSENRHLEGLPMEAESVLVDNIHRFSFIIDDPDIINDGTWDEVIAADWSIDTLLSIAKSKSAGARYAVYIFFEKAQEDFRSKESEQNLEAFASAFAAIAEDDDFELQGFSYFELPLIGSALSISQREIPNRIQLKEAFWKHLINMLKSDINAPPLIVENLDKRFDDMNAFVVSRRLHSLFQIAWYYIFLKPYRDSDLEQKLSAKFTDAFNDLEAFYLSSASSYKIEGNLSRSIEIMSAMVHYQPLNLRMTDRDLAAFRPFMDELIQSWQQYTTREIEIALYLQALAGLEDATPLTLAGEIVSRTNKETRERAYNTELCQFLFDPSQITTY